MKYSTSLIQIKRNTVIHFVIAIFIFAVVTPVLADYLGPNRTVTQTTSECKVILYECQYIASKDAWKYHNVDNWSCSNEGKPWTAYSSSPSSQGCFSATAGDTYWAKEEVLKQVKVTHPPATINNSLQNCNLNNGWCNSAPELALSATEPLSAYNILAIEGSLNGQTFACQGSNCSVPLNEGNNDLTFWALSSWGDSSEMSTFSAKVDTVPPTLGLDISASNGLNGWYVSPASVAATGSDSTSGLSSILLSVNNGLWESSATVKEGVHIVDVRATDNAGNISNTSSIISIDTTTPSIDISSNGTTGKNGWYVSNLEVVASATDTTSGVGSFEVSSDGGAYIDYAFPIMFSDGYHTLQFKATDVAGNETQTPLQEFHIDTIAPTVDIPTSWNAGEMVTYKVQDDGSGLSELRIVIEDEDERYTKVAWNENVSGSKFKGEIIWNGTFKDGMTAQPGDYLVWIKVRDMAGNERFALGIVTVPSPFSLFQSTAAETAPTTIPNPPKELFDEEAGLVESTSSPVISFGGAAAQTKEIETTTLSVSANVSSAVGTVNSNVLWGAVAAAVVSVATGYALDEKRKREEEEARQKSQIKTEVDAKNAALEAGRQAKWDAQKVQNWLDGQDILKAHIETAKNQGATDEQISSLKDTASQQGLGAAIGGAVKLSQNLHNAAVHTARLEAKMSLYQAEDEAQFLAMQHAAQQKAEAAREMAALQAGLAAYHSARREDETQENASAETNWWEKTKSYVNEKIVQPVNASLYQPVIKPVTASLSETISNGISSFNQNFYQPVVKPVIESTKEAISSGITYLDNTVYQPFIKPRVEQKIDAIKDELTWVNNHVYQPIVKPAIQQKIDAIRDELTWVNTHVYQPIIKPVVQQKIEKIKTSIEWVNEHIYQPIAQPIVSAVNDNFIQPFVQSVLDITKEGIENGISWINDNIYQPIFQPVVSDINKYIYQPAVTAFRNTWDKYGEWVHGSLDAVGLIPGLGEIADGLNGLIYLGEGRYIEAGISALAMIPILGDLGKAGKWTVKAGAEVLEEAAEKVAKEVVEEVMEKAAKETAEEVSEKVFKQTAEEIIEITTKETVEQVSGKTIKETSQVLINKVAKESLEETAEKAVKETSEAALEKTVQKTTNNILEKAGKDTSEAITSASLEKASKEVKEKFAEQAFEKFDDKTFALINSLAKELGDDVVSINKAVVLIQKHGDDAVKALKAVEPEAAAKVLRTVDGSVLDDVVQQGSDAVAAFSGWTEKELKDHGKDLAARAAKDAETLNDVKTLVSKGPIDPKNLTDEQKLLIEKIAANSTFYVDGNKVVVGKWVGLDGGFLKRANETGALHYSPHPDLWPLFSKLDNQTEAAWLINKQVIQTGIEKGLPFEYTLNDISLDLIDNERAAIKAIFSGQTEELVKRKLNSDYLPVRMSELKELKEAGFNLNFDEISNSYILTK